MCDSEREQKPTTMQIKILDNGGSYELDVRVKPTTPIIKVLRAWGDKFGLTLKGWVFMLDGDRVKIIEEDGTTTKATCADLGIDEDCQIDAALHQEGGGSPIQVAA